MTIERCNHAHEKELAFEGEGEEKTWQEIDNLLIVLFKLILFNFLKHNNLIVLFK